MQGKAIFHDVLQTCGQIEQDLTKTKKNYKALALYLHFADFLMPGKWLGNARLFQEFKTLYEPLSLN